ncbi:MAG: phosphoribosylformylglycinamidine synthase subunit PurS [Geminicoccaceae bacterium]|nr:MAG: phosphoribosylformylglycinamidine synthase subunit PurS [Geminicoccaceae bacterium]
MKVKITVSLRTGVLDPAAETIHRSMGQLGFEAVTSVVQRRVFEVDIAKSDRDAVLAEAHAMADKLLANPVIETFTVDLVE